MKSLYSLRLRGVQFSLQFYFGHAVQHEQSKKIFHLNLYTNDFRLYKEVVFNIFIN